VTTSAASDPGSPDIVNVPVPRAHLGVVYAALGAAMAGERETPTGVLVNERSGIWTEEMVQRLQAQLRYAGVRALLDLCAERTPEEVMLHEVVEQTGIEVTKIRAQLSALTKLCKRLFERDTWPISVRWTDNGYGIYSMKAEIAAWWSKPNR
jgi:hypothetical protein